MKNIEKTIFDERLDNLKEIIKQEIKSYDSKKNNHETISFNDEDFDDLTKKIIKKLINDGDQGVNAVSPDQLKLLSHEIKIKLHELFMEFGTDSKFKYNPSSSSDNDQDSASTPLASIQESVLNPESSSTQPQVQTQASSPAQTSAKAQSQTLVQPQSQPQPQAQAQTQTLVQPQSQPQPQTLVQPQSQASVQASDKTPAQPQSQASAQTSAQALAQAQASVQASDKTPAQPQSQASDQTPAPALAQDLAQTPAQVQAEASSSAQGPAPALAQDLAQTPAQVQAEASSSAQGPAPAPDQTQDPAQNQNSNESKMSEKKYLDNSGDIIGLIQAEKGKFIEKKGEFIGDFNSTLCKAKFFIAEIGNFEINFSLVRLLKELDDKEITEVKSDQITEPKNLKQSCKEIIETWKAISNWLSEDISEDKIFFEENNSNTKSIPAWKKNKPLNCQDLLKGKKFSLEKKINLKEFVIKIKNHDIAIKKYLDELKQAMEEEIKQDGDKKIFPIWKQDYFFPPRIFYKNSPQSSQNLESDVSSKEVKIDDLLKLIERKINERKEKIKSGKMEVIRENEGSEEIKVTVKIEKKAYYNLKSRPNSIIDSDHHENLKKSVEALNSLSSSVTATAQTAIASTTASQVSVNAKVETSIRSI
jgi:hypothetical protein